MRLVTRNGDRTRSFRIGTGKSTYPVDTYYAAGYTVVMMKNITLAIDEATIDAGRVYAARHQTTLNGLVRDLLARVVMTDRRSTVAEMFRLMDGYPGHSGGARWSRDDLHDR